MVLNITDKNFTLVTSLKDKCHQVIKSLLQPVLIPFLTLTFSFSDRPKNKYKVPEYTGVGKQKDRTKLCLSHYLFYYLI